MLLYCLKYDPVSVTKTVFSGVVFLKIVYIFMYDTYYTYFNNNCYTLFTSESDKYPESDLIAFFRIHALDV